MFCVVVVDVSPGLLRCLVDRFYWLLCRWSYLPEAPDIALNVAGYSLICGGLLVHGDLGCVQEYTSSTKVWRWLPYQAPMFLSDLNVTIYKCKTYSPVAEQPEVIVVTELFYLFLMVCHIDDVQCS